MIRRVEAGKGATLSDINALVAQTETTIGSLVGIGHDATQSFLFFSSKKAAKPASIAAWSDASPDRGDDAFIDRDDLYIENTLTFCVASR